jgi:hypothetical protein
MRRLGDSGILKLSLEEWEVLRPYLLDLGYHWLSRPGGKHPVLWEPTFTTCVGETLDGCFFFDERFREDLPPWLYL